MERIKQSEVWKVMQLKVQGKAKPFSFKYVRLNDSREGNGVAGSIAEYPVGYLTSIHSLGNTVNIRLQGDKSPRKFLKCMIISINGKKIYP